MCNFFGLACTFDDRFKDLMAMRAGKCGNGPNLVKLPEEVFVCHISTPAQVARLLGRFLENVDVQERMDALTHRRMANALFVEGKYEEAITCYSDALERVSSGKHKLYANR